MGEVISCVSSILGPTELQLHCILTRQAYLKYFRFVPSFISPWLFPYTNEQERSWMAGLGRRRMESGASRDEQNKICVLGILIALWGFHISFYILSSPVLESPLWFKMAAFASGYYVTLVLGTLPQYGPSANFCKLMFLFHLFDLLLLRASLVWELSWGRGLTFPIM